MRRTAQLITALTLALASFACSSGSGGTATVNPTAYLWNGTWEYDAVQVSTTCDPDPTLGTLAATYIITVEANTATIVAGQETVVLPIVGERIEGLSESASTRFNLELVSDSTFTGTLASILQDGCEVVFEVTGTRTGPPTTAPNPGPGAQAWIGTWDYTATLAATTCEPNPPLVTVTDTFTITVAGDMATIDLGPFSVEIPIVNGRIQGYSPFNLVTYDLGLTGNDTFTGTQSSEGATCPTVYDYVGTRVGS